MIFHAHGDFDISINGEIVMLSFFGSWNVEGARAFFAEYKAAVERSGLTRFGVLSDLSGLEGGTPDAIDFFEEISAWAQHSGQVARAQITDSAVRRYTVQRVDNGQEPFPIKTVASREEAFRWFESFGLSTS